MTARWEQLAESRWGRYLFENENRVLQIGMRKAHSRAGPTRALEIGCEAGRWTRILVDAGFDVASTDVNPETLQICQERVPEAKCILVQPEDTTLPASANDLALLTCCEVAQVMHETWFFDEAARVVAPGGILFVVVMNRHSYRRFLWSVGRWRRGATTAYEKQMYKRSYLAWRRELTSRGFNVVHEEGMCWVPFGRSSNSRLVNPAVKLERLLRLNKLVAVSPWLIVVLQKDGEPVPVSGTPTPPPSHA